MKAAVSAARGRRDCEPLLDRAVEVDRRRFGDGVGRLAERYDCEPARRSVRREDRSRAYARVQTDGVEHVDVVRIAAAELDLEPQADLLHLRPVAPPPLVAGKRRIEDESRHLDRLPRRSLGRVPAAPDPDLEVRWKRRDPRKARLRPWRSQPGAAAIEAGPERADEPGGARSPVCPHERTERLDG